MVRLATIGGGAGVVCGVIGAVAVGLTAVGVLLGSSAWPSRAFALLAAAYAVDILIKGGALDPGAAALAAGLLLSCEFAHLSVDLRPGTSVDPGYVYRRLAAVTVITIGGLALGAIALWFGSLHTGASGVLTAIGCAAGVLAVWLVAWLARTSADSERAGR